MIDHLLWAVPSLDEGRRTFAAWTGVEAGPGGRHPGVGTHNALLDLGDERYLEILALDPAQDRRASLGLLLEDLREPGLLTWCARADDLDAVASEARGAGLEPGEPLPMSRDRPDGTRLEWRLLFLDGHDAGPLVPFFIEWGQGADHPSRAAPSGCRLTRFALGHPRPREVAGILGALALDIEVEASPSPRLVASLETPRGDLELVGPPGADRLS